MRGTIISTPPMVPMCWVLCLWLLVVSGWYWLERRRRRPLERGAWALVVGSTGGVGSQLCRRLAAQGVRLCLLCNNTDKLVSQRSELQSLFPTIDILTYTWDLRDSANAHQRCTEIIALLAKKEPAAYFRYAFMNAGYTDFGAFEYLSASQCYDAIQLHIASTVVLTHGLYQHMVTRGHKNRSKTKGSIVFTSSSTSALPSPYLGVYGACKAFITAFARDLSVEAALTDIGVHSLQVGVIDGTEFYSHIPTLRSQQLLALFAVDAKEVAKALCQVAAGPTGQCSTDLGIFMLACRWITSLVDPSFLASTAAFVQSIFFFYCPLDRQATRGAGPSRL